MRIQRNVSSIWGYHQLLDLYYGSLIYPPAFSGKFLEDTGKKVRELGNAELSSECCGDFIFDHSPF